MPISFGPPRYMTNPGPGPVFGPPRPPTPYGPYRFEFYDLLTRRHLGDFPLKGVKFGRRLNAPGSFSATLPLTDPKVQALDPWEATQTAKTLIVVATGNTIVWAGILWTSQYQRSTAALALGGNEAFSYFTHRVQRTNWPGTTAESALAIAAQFVQDVIAVPYSALADMTIEVNYVSGVAQPVTVAIPGFQTIDQVIGNLAGMGYGVGFDWTIEWAYDAGGVPRPTMTMWFPRAGRTDGEVLPPDPTALVDPTTLPVTYHAKVLESQPAFDFLYPEDGTTCANIVLALGSGGTAASALGYDAVGQGWPELDEVIQFNDFSDIGVLSSLAAAELQTHQFPTTAPTVDVDPLGHFALGGFDLGDDIRWVVPRQIAVGAVSDERFPD